MHHLSPTVIFPFVALLCSQALAGVIRFGADHSRCLAASAPGGRVFLGDCDHDGGSTVQFTTTGTGPIHWAKHPDQCIVVDVTAENALALKDCKDVVNSPAAQFVAMQNGLLCLEDHSEMCVRFIEGTTVRAMPCAVGESECVFSLTDAIRRYARSEGFVDGEFFSRFTFFDGDDPTHGKVNYVTQADAQASGLIHEAEGKVFIGADVKTKMNKTGGAGRKSVRIESKAVWREGLFVVSLDHVPTGCGTWPAMWLLGENPEHPWPQWGEYDIIEGTHETDRVSTTLHTGVGCSQQGLPHDFSGTWQMGIDRKSTNCDVGAPGQYGNQGCSQLGPKDSLGPAFNANGGGTYAAEWDPEAGYIRTWFWRRGTEPSDLLQGVPDPGRWAQPYSFFRLGDMCPASHFRDMRLIFDLTFCGDLGNPTFAHHCPTQAAEMSCEDLVANHPELLDGAFWAIRGLDVYTLQRPVDSPTEPPPPKTSARPTGRPPWEIPAEPQLVPGKPEPIPWDIAEEAPTPALQPLQPLPEDLVPVQLAAPPAPVTMPPRWDAPQEPQGQKLLQPIGVPRPPSPGEPHPAEIEDADDEDTEPQGEVQDSHWLRWTLVFIFLLALCLVGVIATGPLPTGMLQPSGLGLGGSEERTASNTSVTNSSSAMGEAFTNGPITDVPRMMWMHLANLRQHPWVNQVLTTLVALGRAFWAAIVELYSKCSLPLLQSQCATTCKACRGQYNSLWEAVSGLDVNDDGQLKPGDQVVVRTPFIAESGTIFGTRLQTKMKGEVEEVHEDGTAVIQFMGHLGRFPVAVPVESQCHLQVDTGGVFDFPTMDDKSPLLQFVLNSKPVGWMFAHKAVTLSMGVGLIVITLIAQSWPHEASSDPKECTPEYLDCRETLFCCDPTHTCYQKTEAWGSCLPECKPGIHYDEEPQWRSPWTCNVLAPARRTRRLEDNTSRRLFQTMALEQAANASASARKAQPEAQTLDVSRAVSFAKFNDRWRKMTRTAIGMSSRNERVPHGFFAPGTVALLVTLIGVVGWGFSRFQVEPMAVGIEDNAPMVVPVTPETAAENQ